MSAIEIFHVSSKEAFGSPAPAERNVNVFCKLGCWRK